MVRSGSVPGVSNAGGMLGTNQKALVPSRITSWDESCYSLVRRTPVVPPRLSFQFVLIRFHTDSFAHHCDENLKKTTTHLRFKCCVGTVHPSYLPLLSRLSSDGRSRRGSEEAKSFRTCTNHRIATGRRSSYYLRSTRARCICLFLQEYIASRRLSTAATLPFFTHW
jgi:hypothetical protein